MGVRIDADSVHTHVLVSICRLKSANVNALGGRACYQFSNAHKNILVCFLGWYCASGTLYRTATTSMQSSARMLSYGLCSPTQSYKFGLALMCDS